LHSVTFAKNWVPFVGHGGVAVTAMVTPALEVLTTPYQISMLELKAEPAAFCQEVTPPPVTLERTSTPRADHDEDIAHNRGVGRHKQRIGVRRLGSSPAGRAPSQPRQLGGSPRAGPGV